MKVSDVEPLLRFGVTGIQNAMNQVNRLPSTEHDRVIDQANHHMHEAINLLRQWARVNEVEIRESMHT